MTATAATFIIGDTDTTIAAMIGITATGAMIVVTGPIMMVAVIMVTETSIDVTTPSKMLDVGMVQTVTIIVATIIKSVGRSLIRETIA
jgi:hypothetical protein